MKNYSNVIGNFKAEYRDILLSVLTGPIRFLIPIIGYMIIYPLLLKYSGDKLLGLWTLVSSLVAFSSLGDIGFSLILLREAGGETNNESTINAVIVYKFAKVSYIVLFLLSLLITIFFFEKIKLSIGRIYDANEFILTVFLLLISSTLSLIAKLNTAIISARRDNFYSQCIQSVAIIPFLVICIISIPLGRPMLGLAIGHMISAIFTMGMSKYRIFNKHKDWLEIVGLKNNATMQEIISKRALLYDALHLYTISVGMSLREPLSKIILSCTLGLTAVGIFSVAMRLCTSIRDLIAFGFGVLYPNFSNFFRSNDINKIKTITSYTIKTIIPVATVAFGFLIFYCDIVLSLWLGNNTNNSEINGIIQILSFWCLLTVLNIPFWHILIASKNEFSASISIWTHTILIMFYFPLSYVRNVNINDFGLYWSITSLLTQILIYYTVESKLGIFIEIMKRNFNAVIVFVSFLFLFLTIGIKKYFPINSISIYSIFLTLLILYIYMNVTMSKIEFRRLFCILRDIKLKN